MVQGSPARAVSQTVEFQSLSVYFPDKVHLCILPCDWASLGSRKRGQPGERPPARATAVPEQAALFDHAAVPVLLFDHGLF